MCGSPHQRTLQGSTAVCYWGGNKDRESLCSPDLQYTAHDGIEVNISHTEILWFLLHHVAVGWEFIANSILELSSLCRRSKQWCCNSVSTVSWHILGHLTPSEHHLNATPFLAADQKHLFMAAVYPFSIGHLQQNNELCYKASIISASFQGNHNDFSLLNWPGIRPAQHL